MELKYGEAQSANGLSAEAKAQISVSLTEHDHNQYIVISTEEDAPLVSHRQDAGERSIEIPASLLPELKRALETVEAECGHDATAEPGVPANRITFAHPSEEEFVRILDFYCIRWEYEPRTFPIEWDAEGNVVSSFTPDFYLPEHDLFLELTTLKQGLVTKKNRKVRLLRELYPEINIKVLYASDYRKLIEKFAASDAWSQENGAGAEEGLGLQADEE
jgi:hypothetical protein